jgi:hypothetical protein
MSAQRLSKALLDCNRCFFAFVLFSLYHTFILTPPMQQKR